MKNIKAVLILLLIFALFAGVLFVKQGTGITPGETLEIYYNYIKGWDYERAYDFLSKDFKKQCKRELYYPSPPWGNDWWKILIAVDGFHRDVTSHDGKKRILQKVSITDAVSGNKAHYDVVLALEDNQWKIDRIELVSREQRPCVHRFSPAEQNKIASLMDQGEALFLKDKLEDASVYFEKVLQVYPNNSDAHAYLGICYGQLAGRTVDVWKAITYGGESGTHYEKALEINPNNLLAHLGRGEGLLYAPVPYGDARKAAADFKFVLKREPRNLRALFGLASAYKKGGENILAQQTFREILSLAPNYPHVKDELETLVKNKVDKK